MATATRTFSKSLTPLNTAGEVIELSHLRDMTFSPNEMVGVYLESFFCNMSLRSFALGRFPDFDGDETEAEKLAKFTLAENQSQKLGMRILTKKNDSIVWKERAEVILVNRGRKDYFDLLNPYLSQGGVRLLEVNDSIAVELIDYGDGLLKGGDFIEIEAGVRVDVSQRFVSPIGSSPTSTTEDSTETITVGSGGSILLNPNPNRKIVKIFVESVVDGQIWVIYGSNAILANAAHPLPTGYLLTIDTLQASNAISVFSDGSGATLRVSRAEQNVL